jgi:hypothetical protein
MSRFALEEWLNEASGDVAGGQAPSMTPDSLTGGAPAGDPNAANPPGQMAPDSPAQQQNSPEAAKQGAPDAQKNNQMPDVSSDPSSPDMPEKTEKKDFEQWKNDYFKESVRGDASKLIELIQQVRDNQLEAYPRKFVEDNLQICFLRQNANIDKAGKSIRNSIKQDLDQNNPSVSVVNHMYSGMQATPDLNNVFIKLKGLLGMKGDLHRKYIGSLLGAVQVGSGGNNEDIIYNEKDYSIRISTRFNDKWGRLDLGKWSLREDDPERYLTEPERKRMEEGSPEEKDVLRRRVVMESIAETFKRRSFIVNVVSQNGTIYTLGWDLAGSLKNAYTSGKLIVRTVESDNSEAMIDDNGTIIPYVDIKVKYVKNGQGTDENGHPIKEEHDFMERIDGILFLTAQFKILKEAASSFSGIVLKETPYNGNPSDLNVLMRCIPSAPEILLRSC